MTARSSTLWGVTVSAFLASAWATGARAQPADTPPQVDEPAADAPPAPDDEVASSDDDSPEDAPAAAPTRTSRTASGRKVSTWSEVPAIEREQQDTGDGWLRFANGALWLPRAVVEGIFFATGMAGNLIEDQQIVPRVRDMLDEKTAAVFVFPTAFFETGSILNVGVRMLARGPGFASSARVGFGGYDDMIVDTKLRFSQKEPLPFVLGGEWFAQRRSRAFRGIGQDPANDPRNAFAGPLRVGRFRESRVRYIGSYGIRAGDSIELFISSSLQRRLIRDARGYPSNTITEVFVPGSLSGINDVSLVTYSEIATRVDTRDTRGGPATGVLLEGYGGLAKGIEPSKAAFGRTGARAAAFFSVYKSSNVLSPKLVLDGLYDIDGSVPFFELPTNADFRGFDNRTDYVSAVASLDYRWAIWRYAAARIFVDAATVAPSVPELTPKGARWATGLGFDLFTGSSPLGSTLISMSPDGVRFLVQIGTPGGFGDRQHR